MLQWLPAAILSLLSFGLWGLFTKYTILQIDSKSALIFQTVGVMIIGLITLNMIEYKPMTTPKGITFGILTGLAYAVGCFFYFIAVNKGKVITVVTLTALYPMVTILLSYFFMHESINSKQFLGILIALFAIYLMSQ